MHFSVNYLFTDVVIDLLRRGDRVRFRAPGSSMVPTIRDEEVIGVEPVEPSEIKRGDIILYQNGKGVIAHRVVRIVNERPTALREEERLKEPRGAAFGLEAKGAAYSLEAKGTCGSTQEVLRQNGNQHSSLSDEPSAVRIDPSASSVSAPRVKRSSNGALAECSLSGAFFERSGPFFVLRGDASAVCDEPITAQQVLGKVVFVERDGCLIPLDNTKSKICQICGILIYRFKRSIVRHMRRGVEIKDRG